MEIVYLSISVQFFVWLLNGLMRLGQVQPLTSAWVCDAGTLLAVVSSSDENHAVLLRVSYTTGVPDSKFIMQVWHPKYDVEQSDAGLV